MLTLKPTTEDARELMKFDFEGANVRVATVDGEAMFVMTDVCAVLEIAKRRRRASSGRREKHPLAPSARRRASRRPA